MWLLDKLLGKSSSKIPARSAVAMSPMVVRIPHSDAYVVVVGESRYQENLWMVAEESRRGGVDCDTVAVLEPEPTNTYDPLAVRVSIDGRTVGYLPRPLAEELQPIILQIESDLAAQAAVDCHLKGGFEKRDGTTADIGVKLYFDPDYLRRIVGLAPLGIAESALSVPCPYCGHELKPVPKRSRKCPGCGKTAWVRERFFDRRMLLVTREQADAIDLEYQRYYAARSPKE